MFSMLLLYDVNILVHNVNILVHNVNNRRRKTKLTSIFIELGDWIVREINYFTDIYLKYLDRFYQY